MRPINFWRCYLHFLACNGIVEHHVSDNRYLIPKHDRVRGMMGLRFMSRIYNPFWFVLGIKPKAFILDEKTTDSIRKKMRDNIQEFYSLFSLDRSFWKYFFDKMLDGS